MIASPAQTTSPAEPLLAIRDLRVQFHTRHATLNAVRDLSLTLHPGEIVGLVGESGCGKSVTAQAILRLIGDNPHEDIQGEITYQGNNLLDQSEAEMARLRGRSLAMIFQDPMTALNPVLPVGEQIAEGLRWHLNYSRRAAHQRAIELLGQVGISEAARRARQYPHEFSGGMRQRVVIAIAISCQPQLLIADEPTTALDATLQSQILDLLLTMRSEAGAALLLITHDLDVVANVCDRVAVMYAGTVVESAATADLIGSPQHPYTQGLLASIPKLGHKGRLHPIPGQPPDPGTAATGCLFADRCPYAHERCQQTPPRFACSDTHHASCWLLDSDSQESSS